MQRRDEEEWCSGINEGSRTLFNPEDRRSQASENEEDSEKKLQQLFPKVTLGFLFLNGV